jgi:hypothetical protein
MLSRKWWSLRSLEGFLSVATGNPSSISLQDCSVPLPRTLPGNIHGVQSTALLQLFSKITVISQWAVSLLYTGRTATLSQASLQERVSMTKTELETMLPHILEREHLVLQLAWFDAMMLITRPCLCIQIKSSRLSGPALQILQKIGKQCIQAARGITSLLPAQPDESIYRTGPWWCLLHYIVRALRFLLFTLSSQSLDPVDPDIGPCVAKLIRWLEWIRHDDLTTAQGLTMALNTLRRSNHADLPGIFETEASEGLESRVILPDTSETGNAQYSHGVYEPSSFDLFLDAYALVNPTMSQLAPDTLAMPLTYGNASASAGNTCVW